jgi:hypothetical protein
VVADRRGDTVIAWLLARESPGCRRRRIRSPLDLSLAFFQRDSFMKALARLRPLVPHCSADSGALQSPRCASGTLGKLQWTSLRCWMLLGHRAVDACSASFQSARGDLLAEWLQDR